MSSRPDPGDTPRRRRPAIAPLVVGVAALAASACAASHDDAEAADVEIDQSAWETRSVADAEASTHLFLVEQAMRIVGRHEDLPGAARVLRIMNEPACKARWQEGLHDADFVPSLNDGISRLPDDPSTLDIFRSLSTWASHFYDPDTGKNYRGQTTPTARSRGADAVALMRMNGVDRGRENGCYHLGVALHFMTDLTQPMHTANFGALQRPLELHVNLEHFALDLHPRHAIDDWLEPPVTDDPIAMLEGIAKRTKTLWPATAEAVSRGYARSSARSACRSTLRPGGFLGGPLVDEPSCWRDEPEVERAVGRALVRAQHETAVFLVAVGDDMLRTEAMFPPP